MYHSHEAYETPELNSLEFSSDRLLKPKKIVDVDRWKVRKSMENPP